MEDISKILQTERVQSNKSSLGFFDKKKQKKKKPWHSAKTHFDELTKIVDETHKELKAKNSPFRVCIYQEEDDIFIDVITVDDSGNTQQVFKHDISHEELEDLVHHIKSGRGLILDSDA